MNIYRHTIVCAYIAKFKEVGKVGSAFCAILLRWQRRDDFDIPVNYFNKSFTSLLSMALLLELFFTIRWVLFVCLSTHQRERVNLNLHKIVSTHLPSQLSLSLSSWFYHQTIRSSVCLGGLHAFKVRPLFCQTVTTGGAECEKTRWQHQQN